MAEGGNTQELLKNLKEKKKSKLKKKKKEKIQPSAIKENFHLVRTQNSFAKSDTV